MTDFKALVTRVTVRQTSLEALQIALEQALQQQPQKADEYLQLLTKLGEKGLLAQQTIDALTPLVMQYCQPPPQDSLPNNNQPLQFPELVAKSISQRIDFDTLRQGLMADLKIAPEKQPAYLDSLARLAEQSYITDDMRQRLQAVIEGEPENVAADNDLPEVEVTLLADRPLPEPSPAASNDQVNDTAQTQTPATDLAVTVPSALPSPEADSAASSLKVVSLVSTVKATTRWLLTGGFVGLGVFGVYDFLQSPQQSEVDAFIQLLITQQYGQIEQQIQTLLDSDTSTQQQFFGITGVDIELQAYLKRRTVMALDELHFTKAERFLGWYQKIYPDTHDFKVLTQAKHNAIAQLDQQLWQTLDEGNWPEQYGQVAAVWPSLAESETDYGQSMARLVAFALAKLTDQFAEKGQYTKAGQVARFATQLLADHPRYSANVRWFEVKQTAYEALDNSATQAWASLEAILKGQQGHALTDYAQLLEDIAQIQRLEPVSKDLQLILSGLERALTVELSQLKATTQWQQAYTLIERFAKPLGKAKQLKLKDQVLQAQLSREKNQQIALRKRPESKSLTQLETALLADDGDDGQPVAVQPDGQGAVSIEAIRQKANDILQREGSLAALNYGYAANHQLPQSTEMDGLIDDLYQEASQSVVNLMRVHQAEIETNIDAWAGEPDAMVGINALKRDVMDYGVYDAQKAGQKRQAITALLVEKAKIAMVYGEPDNARRLLNEAHFFTPSSAEVDATRRKVMQAVGRAAQDSQANWQQQYRSALLASFKVQLVSGNIALAEQRLTQIRRDPLGRESAEAATTQLMETLGDKFTLAVKAQDALLAQKWLNAIARYDFVPDALNVRLNKLQQTIANQLQQIRGANVPNHAGQSLKPCTEQLQGAGKSCFDLIDQDQPGPTMVVLPQRGGAVVAISRYEITVGDYNHYCQATGHCAQITNQMPSMPVTGLPLTAMQAYSQWLTAVTGKSYRLATYQQWLNAADGANQTQSYVNCGIFADGMRVRGFLPVAANYNSTQAQNGWGVAHQMGNVAEVVEDSGGWWVVGGSWQDPVKDCHADARQPYDGSAIHIGFRLTRDI